jgi:putative FmdB family regulatory protein
MPKYTFECICTVRFSRTLKMGQHPTHKCPSCGAEAPRLFEEFAFEFARQGKAPANSGVSKHDYPTADIAVGADADSRWETIRARDRVKDQVRKEGGHRALIRRQVDGGVEYEAGSDRLIENRKKLLKDTLSSDSGKGE